jgi:adenosylcobinamide kinase/adenosylcobinamide-phosphate guanylyltransferase
MEDFPEEEIKTRMNQIMQLLKEVKYDSFIVSNEVGMGIVPEHPLGRKFRDIGGSINQLVAKHSDNVFFVVSGIPMQLK